MIKMRSLLISLLAAGFICACSNDYVPKPRGYYRINLPEKAYIPFDSTGFPYSFEYPKYASVMPNKGRITEPYWVNLVVPELKATIYLSYKSLKGEKLSALLEDSHTLLYKQSVKAESIEESDILLPERKIYGILYDVGGDAASPVQFYITDSTTHFIRGALYFYSTPNKDSLAPVVAFMRQDILKMIDSFHWRK
jgi:gliding motility-associated lipoprotein GldD